METGDVIKKLRNEKKFTQSELGIMLGVNTSSIQKYESGATKNLKLETIRELCQNIKKSQDEKNHLDLAQSLVNLSFFTIIFTKSQDNI